MRVVESYEVASLPLRFPGVEWPPTGQGIRLSPGQAWAARLTLPRGDECYARGGLVRGKGGHTGRQLLVRNHPCKIQQVIRFDGPVHILRNRTCQLIRLGRVQAGDNNTDDVPFVIE